MTPTPWLLFDWDDTLGGCRAKDRSVRPGHHAYFDTIDRFGDHMASLGFDKSEAIAVHDDIDRQMAAQHGFALKSRFADSMVLAYEHLGGAATLDKQDIHAIGMSVFTDYPYAALEGALDVLHTTLRYFNIAIVTKGEEKEQRRKIRETGAMGFVGEQNVFVVPKKDVADWDAVLNALRITPTLAAESWGIGNSLKADVNPLLRRGFNGIWLNDPSGWSFEHDTPAPTIDGCEYHEVADITEVLGIIPMPR